MVVLVDCDNFFASCERVMQPHLQTKPVAVLSNNDGCIIARSNEVKKAGVKMGQPYHECKALLDSINAEVLSANFLLYRHFAKRMQGILRSIPTESLEVYSIDESFLEISTDAIEDIEVWANTLRNTILNWTGLPVSIGVGPSRALAKLASHVAKQQKGVYVLDVNKPSAEEILRQTPVQEIWGIGRRLAPKLEICGIKTAYDFTLLTKQSPALKLLDSTTKDLVFQLRGWSSGTATPPAHQKSIMYSRSFGMALSDKAALRASLASFCTELASKLRRKGLVADKLLVSVRYRTPGKTHGTGQSVVIHFGAWTDDTFLLCQAADTAIDQLFETGKSYIKAMALLPELRTVQQLSLLTNNSSSDDLLCAMDTLVGRHGAAGPRIATSLLTNTWRGKQQRISPYNHAEWGHLPQVITG